MTKQLKILLLLILMGIGVSYLVKGNKEKADILFYNGTIYTVDSVFSQVESVVVKDGKIIATGTFDSMQSRFGLSVVHDLEGAVMFPGFIDAHCHFYGYGMNSQKLELRGVESLEALEQAVVEYSTRNKGEWILGRGWNEEHWEGAKEVNNLGLNRLFPDIPICLQRVDGHSVLANQAALDAAGITANTEIEGGDVIVKDGVMTGVLVDNAASKLMAILPDISDEQIQAALFFAQKHCFAKGLTTVADAGLDLGVIKTMQAMTGDQLLMRVYAMSNPNDEEVAYFREHGPIDEARLKVRSFKLYGDGSLGSRSAWLKEAYCGDDSNFGLPQADTTYFKEICAMARELGFQLNTHCIGDSANAVFLKLYADALNGLEDARWRIEHAQIVDPKDMAMFAELKVIPSVQPTHAISDMHMAKDRLCGNLEGAYAYKSLLAHAGMIAFGTDFPVEKISPLATFYTAVERKNDQGELFEEQEAISREDAIKAMTIWAAYACFMENEVGSIEIGKNADFTILDTDLITAEDLKNVQVLATFVGGKQVYSGR